MDRRLNVTDSWRPGGSDDLADMPVVTLAWRAMHLEHEALTERRRKDSTEADRRNRALVGVADELHALRREAAGADPDAEPAARRLLDVAARLQKLLADAGVTVVAPEGERYTDALMELIDNTAQVPVPEADGPRVAEVLKPAVVDRSGVLRMGKAVIAVPAGGPGGSAPPQTPADRGGSHRGPAADQADDTSAETRQAE